MISVEINDREVHEALNRLSAFLADTSEVMNEIGGYLRDQSKDRFNTETAPDGSAWAPRLDATLKNYERRKKTFGGILHRSGQLRGSLFHQYGPDWTKFGSPDKYAAMMQFGGTRAQFPNLWGDIPAREYLGMSEDDRSDVLDIILEALDRVISG